MRSWCIKPKKVKLFRWTEGRQNSGYRAFTLLYSEYLKMDCYIIHYPTGSSIPPHIDPMVNGKMYRLNIEIWKPKSGGIFHSKTLLNIFNRAYLFRPDVEEHYVTEITEGNRWLFSIGKVIENKA